MGKEYDFFKDKGLHNESIDLGFNHKSGLFVNGGYTRNNHGGWQGDLTGREKRFRHLCLTAMSVYRGVSLMHIIIVILQSSTSVIMVPNASIKVNGSVSSLLPVWHGLFLMSLFGIHLKM